MRDNSIERLRRLFDEIAPPTDVDGIARRVRTRQPAEPLRVWIVVIAAAVMTTVIVGAVLIVRSPGQPPSEPTASTLTPQPSTTVSAPTTTESPTTSMDPRLVEATLLDRRLESLVEEILTINSDWERSRINLTAVRDRLDTLEETARAELVIPWEVGEFGELDALLSKALSDAIGAIADIAAGFEAPDDGTLRRVAVADFVMSVSEARVVLAEYGVEQVSLTDPIDAQPVPQGASVVLSVEGHTLGWFLGDQEQLGDLAPQVVIAARDSLLNDPAYGLGLTFTERRHALFGCSPAEAECVELGGLIIHTTVDLDLQLLAEDILRDWLSADSGPAGAIAMVDNRTGATVVMASSIEFGFDIEAGQRPTGSLFNTFALVAALEAGIGLESMWDYSTPQVIPVDGGEWTCTNSGSNEPGMRSLKDALVRSTNTVFCQIGAAVGGGAIANVAYRLGISTPLPPDSPTVAVGSAWASPAELALAYSTIANYGERRKHPLVDRIEGRDGEVVFQHQVQSTRVVDEALMAAVVNTLEMAACCGTGHTSILPDGRPWAGKTGSDFSNTDAWFAGFIPQYTAVVWVGFADSHQPMTNVTINGTFFSRVYGSSVPAPIWAEFMDAVVEETEAKDFAPDPPGTTSYYGVDSQ